ncbi:MAG TPA: hypothetical protein VJY34_20940 [Roseiarcus sp.]|nr:hypothetical protein [Roseiarcus sp.]
MLDARRLKDLHTPQQAIVKGDCRSLTIAAASILAKTARDALMNKLDTEYPGYGLSKHKGYPVREHLAALARLGASPVHRRSRPSARSSACRRSRHGRMRRPFRRARKSSRNRGLLRVVSQFESRLRAESCPSSPRASTPASDI